MTLVLATMGGWSYCRANCRGTSARPSEHSRSICATSGPVARTPCGPILATSVHFSCSPLSGVARFRPESPSRICERGSLQFMALVSHGRVLHVALRRRGHSPLGACVGDLYLMIRGCGSRVRGSQGDSRQSSMRSKRCGLWTLLRFRRTTATQVRSAIGRSSSCSMRRVSVSENCAPWT